MMRRHILPGDPRSITWAEHPEYRSDNSGMGRCNTGSGLRVICCLGGIGCNVDHVSVMANLPRPLTPDPGVRQS